MKNLNVLFVLIFLFFSQIGNSQINPEVINKIKGKYYYQGQVYKKHQLRHIYKTNPKAYKAHQSFVKVRRIHRVSTLVSGGAIVGMIKWNKERYRCTGDCNNYVDFTGIIVPFAVLGGTTVLVISTAIPTYKRSGKALKVFNEEVLSTSEVGSIPSYINFQTSQNGIGLVLNF